MCKADRLEWFTLIYPFFQQLEGCSWPCGNVPFAVVPMRVHISYIYIYIYQIE